MSLHKAQPPGSKRITPRPAVNYINSAVLSELYISSLKPAVDVSFHVRLRVVRFYARVYVVCCCCCIYLSNIAL